MADGGGGGRDKTEAVGDCPAQLHSSGEQRPGLQDSHTSGAQPGGAGGRTRVQGAHPELRAQQGLGLPGKLGTGGLCNSGETPGCPPAAGLRAVTGSAGSAVPETPQAVRPCQKRDLLCWGGIPRAKDSDKTRATPRGDFAHAARI